jgi:hypothetical protein
MKQAITSM